MMIEQLIDLVRSIQQSSASTTPNPPAPCFELSRLCSDYASLRGKSFKGIEEVIGIHTWLKTCEHIFTRMGMTDQQKDIIVLSQL